MRLWWSQVLDQITLNKEAMVSNDLEFAYDFKRKTKKFDDINPGNLSQFVEKFLVFSLRIFGTDKL